VTWTLAVLLAAAPLPDAGPTPRAVQVEAARLQVDDRTQVAVYTGQVVARRDGTTLRCDTLTVHYDGARQVTRMQAEGHVEATEGQRWARGDTADYDNRTGLLVVRGNPSARQGNREVDGDEVRVVTGQELVDILQPRTRVKGPDAIAIDAQRLTLDDQSSRATWRGDVRARRGTLTVRCPELTAFYDAQGEVQRLEGRGGVEATDKDRWARGQRMAYDVASGRLEVTGQPQARQGTSRMRGSRVTFFREKDLIEVEDATTSLEVKR
jgi:lipopolysaccharide transport protein LptA